jgi:DNA-binding transcriptional ArsR family regulator
MSASPWSNAPDPREVKFARVLDENLALFRYHFSELMIAHLIDCWRAFGDFEEMLVMEFVGQKFLRSHLDPGAKLTPLSDGSHESVTASRIAKETGIPRQTVRRKLQSLERRGWVTQTEDATWRLAMKEGQAAVSAELASLDKRGLDRLVRLISTLDSHVSRPGHSSK